jgi:hypothetical protein
MGVRKRGNKIIAFQFKFGTKEKKSKPKIKTLGEKKFGVPSKIIESKLAGSDSYPVAAKKIMAMRLEGESWDNFYKRNLEKITGRQEILNL